MTGPDDDRPQFSWDALAAELEATREDEEPDQGWDAVAASLAASLRGPDGATAPDPAAEPADPAGGDPADPAAAEEAAAVDEAPGAARPLTRAPAPPPVELEVVPERELPVEEPALALPFDDDPDDPAGPADPVALRGGLEALLFVVDSPVDEATLAAALRCSVPRARAELTALAADYDDRRAGMVLRRVGEGWRLYTRDEHAPVVERHLLEGQRSRLTQAALETLAVIAYRQPVTRARVSAIRGVGVDAVVRTLVTRGLIAEAGTDPDTGAVLYATTQLFLERLGLTSLAELPDLAPLVPEPRAVLAEHPED